jgi:hypothetical protein
MSSSLPQERSWSGRAPDPVGLCWLSAARARGRRGYVLGAESAQLADLLLWLSLLGAAVGVVGSAPEPGQLTRPALAECDSLRDTAVMDAHIAE